MIRPWFYPKIDSPKDSYRFCMNRESNGERNGEWYNLDNYDPNQQFAFALNDEDSHHNREKWQQRRKVTMMVDLCPAHKKFHKPKKQERQRLLPYAIAHLAAAAALINFACMASEFSSIGLYLKMLLKYPHTTMWSLEYNLRALVRYIWKRLNRMHSNSQTGFPN